MSTRNSEGRYAEICGATNNRGDPCKLPAGWGTPGSGGKRCKFHGGCSTGPDDTDHLEGNDYAKDNPGGGAPELNTNAQTAHGIWGDWRKVYDRLPERRKEYLNRIAEDLIESVTPYTPGMDPGRRRELALEHTVLRQMYQRASYDIFAGFGENPADDARGMNVKREVETDEGTFEVDRPNPSIDRLGSISARERAIEEELNLRDVYQDKEPPKSDDEKTLAETLRED